MELDSEDEYMLVSILILKRRIRRKVLEKKKKRRSVWVKDIFKEREIYGDYHTLLKRMRITDRENFFR